MTPRVARLLSVPLTAAFVASLLLIPSASAAATIEHPNGGVSPLQPEPPTQVELTGTLIEFPTETAPLEIGPGDEAAEPEVSFEGRVFLATEAGNTVRLISPDSPMLSAGDKLTAEVQVPEEVRAAVSAQVQAELLTLDQVGTAELVAAAAQDMEVELSTAEPVHVETVSDSEVAAQLPAAQHTVDVAYLSRNGSSGGVPSDTSISTAVSRLSTYWNRESGGQVSSIAKPLATKFQSVSWDVCGNPIATWEIAAQLFGRSWEWYVQNTAQRHLLVLVDMGDSPYACDGSGLGSVGANVRSGGVMHAEVAVASPADWDGVVFHEFGHNLSLDHSNSRECAPPYSDRAPNSSSNGCADKEYLDFYDVMGGGFSLVDGQGNTVLSNSRNVSSLNATHRQKLDSYGDGLLRVNLTESASQIITMQSSGATSGTRGIEVTDPTTGESLFVEYRGTTGTDGSSFYSRWAQVANDPPGFERFSNGVRVLRTAPTSGRASVLLQTWKDQTRLGYLQPGSLLSSYTGAVNVRVISANGSQAVISISTTPFIEEQEPVIAVVGGGSAWVGKSATVQSVASWAPQPQTVSYQWHRGDDPIVGADEISYTLTAADVGKNITVHATPWWQGNAFAPAVSAPLLPSGPTVSRVSGATRFETAVEVSKKAFPATADVVYLATGSNFPDALAAAPAAAVKGGPLLLVPSDAAQISRSLLDRVTQLKPSRIVAVGGEAAIPNDVVARFHAASPAAEVTRISGYDRFATGNALVRDAFAENSVPRVLIATGNDFPDALSASALAGGTSIPVILVNGKDPLLNSDTLRLLNDLDPSRVTLIGGTNAVSTGIEQQLEQSYSTDRSAGSNRFETSAILNEMNFSGSVSTQYWATGSGFADALSGAVLAGVQHSPLYVVPSTCVLPEVLVAVGQKKVTSVTLIGGPAALSAEVEALIPCV